MDPINVGAVETVELTSSTTTDAEWVGGFFSYGGSGAEESTTIYFAVPPGKRLGRHTETAEETRFILGGSGDLLLDGGSKPVKAGDVVVLTVGTAHDLLNTGGDDPARDRLLLGPTGRAALERGGLGTGRPHGHRQSEPVGPAEDRVRDPSSW